MTGHSRASRLAAELNGERIRYTAEAAEADATLVHPALRTFQVRGSRVCPAAGFEQNPPWYGSDPVNAAVWDYVGAYDERQSRPRRAAPFVPPKNADPELRRKVEKAAVAHAIAYYETLFGPGFEVRSVEAEAKGWDLEVHGGDQPILVQGKGTLGQQVGWGFTPNQ